MEDERDSTKCGELSSAWEDIFIKKASKLCEKFRKYSLKHGVVLGFDLLRFWQDNYCANMFSESYKIEQNSIAG